MTKQRYIVEIEMPDGDFISAGWLKDLIQTDCDLEDEGRKKVTVQETSLPSDLDEVAEEYADYNSQRWHEDGDVYYDHSKIMDAFQTGAKWMAGKFQRVTGDLIDWHQTSDGREFCSGIMTCELLEVPEGFYIRKK